MLNSSVPVVVGFSCFFPFTNGLDYVFRPTFMHGRKEIQGCGGILTVLASELHKFAFFLPASSLTLFCVKPPFITIHRQSEGTTSSRQNTPLTVKRRMAGKTHKNSIEN